MTALYRPILFVLCTALSYSIGQAALADTGDKLTQFEDGIVMTEFSSGSGFEVTGGGGRFNFDYKTKTLTMESAKQHIKANFHDDSSISSR